MAIDWKTQSFDELNKLELFEIVSLRQAVFIVEQQCAYPDIDHLDQQAMHVSGWSNGSLLAYARILKPGLSYPQASIGRVLVNPRARGTQLGKELMQETLKQCDSLFAECAIKIGAQEYLEKFYTELGFVRISDMYLEDGIPHIHMLRE